MVMRGESGRILTYNRKRKISMKGMLGGGECYREYLLWFGIVVIRNRIDGIRISKLDS